MSKLLEVKNLKTSFKTHIGDVQSVRGVSFHLDKGEALGVVGESGCGKSVTMMTIMRLLGENAKIEAETITFADKDITNPTEKLMQAIRGNDMSMIFQDPMTSLNPLFTVGDQSPDIGKGRAAARCGCSLCGRWQQCHGQFL